MYKDKYKELLNKYESLDGLLVETGGLLKKREVEKEQLTKQIEQLRKKPDSAGTPFIFEEQNLLALYQQIGDLKKKGTQPNYSNPELDAFYYHIVAFSATPLSKSPSKKHIRSLDISQGTNNHHEKKKEQRSSATRGPESDKKRHTTEEKDDSEKRRHSHALDGRTPRDAIPPKDTKHLASSPSVTHRGSREPGRETSRDLSREPSPSKSPRKKDASRHSKSFQPDIPPESPQVRLSKSAIDTPRTKRASVDHEDSPDLPSKRSSQQSKTKSSNNTLAPPTPVSPRGTKSLDAPKPKSADPEKKKDAKSRDRSGSSPQEKAIYVKRDIKTREFGERSRSVSEGKSGTKRPSISKDRPSSDVPPKKSSRNSITVTKSDSIKDSTGPLSKSATELSRKNEVPSEELGSADSQKKKRDHKRTGSGDSPLDSSQKATERKRRKKPLKRSNTFNTPLPTQPPAPTTATRLPAGGKGAIRTQIDLTEIHSKVEAAWTQPPAASHLFGDLPRLAPRITLFISRDGGCTVIPPDPSLSPTKQTCVLLKAVVGALEPPHVVENAIKILDSSDQLVDDGAIWMENIFQVIGFQSPTVQLLKSTHQGIIMSAASQLKVIMFSATNQITKDVRSLDGWQIEVHIGPSPHTTHIRKEVSMLPGKDSFQFSWSLTVFLSEDLSLLPRVSLETSNLICDPQFNPIVKEKIESSLASFWSKT